MGLQSCGNPNFENFETSNLGVAKQNDIWVQAPWPGTENTIRGKVVAKVKGEAYKINNTYGLVLPIIYIIIYYVLTTRYLPTY
jgi:hypothetical protein